MDSVGGASGFLCRVRHVRAPPTTASSDTVPQDGGVFASINDLRNAVRTRARAEPLLVRNRRLVVQRAVAFDFKSGARGIMSTTLGIFAPRDGWKLKRPNGLAPAEMHADFDVYGGDDAERARIIEFMKIKYEFGIQRGIVSPHPPSISVDDKWVVRCRLCMCAMSDTIGLSTVDNVLHLPVYADPPCAHVICMACMVALSRSQKRTDPRQAIECPECCRMGVFRIHSQMSGLVTCLNRHGLADLRARAAAGEIDSIVHLAYAVGVGLGVKKDIDESRRLYRIGADAGDAVSQYNLACNIFVYGGGDRQEMRKWMLRAAEQGHRGAMHNMSIIIEDEGIEPEESQQWMRRAAEAGYALAEYTVGLEKAALSDEVEEGKRMMSAAISKGLFNPFVQCAPG
jgi:hypothetical protein